MGGKERKTVKERRERVRLSEDESGGGRLCVLSTAGVRVEIMLSDARD